MLLLPFVLSAAVGLALGEINSAGKGGGARWNRARDRQGCMKIYWYIFIDINDTGSSCVLYRKSISFQNLRFRTALFGTCLYWIVHCSVSLNPWGKTLLKAFGGSTVSFPPSCFCHSSCLPRTSSESNNKQTSNAFACLIWCYPMKSDTVNF